MLEGWIAWTLLAAAMQSVRTAGQKHLIQEMSPAAATLVRYLFGLPFIFLYLVFLWFHLDAGVHLEDLVPGRIFFVSATLAGVLQIVATVLLIELFSLRNFAVGSIYIRTEIVITAILGTLFFSELISPLGWVAVFVCLAGLILVNGVKGTYLVSFSAFLNRSAVYGLASGASFALTSLFLRQASLSLQIDHQISAAVTLCYMICIQTVICFVYIYRWDRVQISRILKQWQPSLFVGITSVAGSAGWFTAMTMMSATYVKTLGQIEFLFSFLIAVFFFREMPSKTELAGMLLILVSVIVLLLS